MKWSSLIPCVTSQPNRPRISAERAAIHCRAPDLQVKSKSERRTLIIMHQQHLKNGTNTTKAVLTLAALLTISSLSSPAAAQTRCDASVAIGHIKRLELPSGGVALVRAGGATLANPTSLTPVCPMDDIRISGAAVAHVEIYGATPVAVRSFSPWRPLRPRANTNMRQNILARLLTNPVDFPAGFYVFGGWNGF
jgi:hypothetical protein